MSHTDAAQAAQEERMMTGTLLLALALAAPAAEQTAPAGNTMVSSIRGGYDLVKGHILKAAEQVPEEMYAFKASPDVRSLGQLFGHIADANFGICSTATGSKDGVMSGTEKSKTTKKDLIAALQASFKFCDAAFDGMTDAKGAETVKFFLPGTNTRLALLSFNAMHDWEHYGNIVTYMRLKGMVPPSSAGR
jgi:uncharacterized damage-inducible protein DinB